MKATGIVRRIDDLGRVVIPKEIRRTLRIREGDPLEIYTERDGEVIFKKYSPMGEMSVAATQICDAIGKHAGHIAAVTDRDGIIAVSGAPKKELLEKSNTRQLQELMTDRKSYLYRAGGEKLPAAEGVDRYYIGIAVPILSGGDLMGSVLLLRTDGMPEFGEAEQRLAQTIAGFLGQQMEN